MPTKIFGASILALALVASSATFSEAAKPAQADRPKVSLRDRARNLTYKVGLASPTIAATAMTVGAYPGWHEAQGIVAVTVGAVNYGLVKGVQKIADVREARAAKRAAPNSWGK